MKWLVLVYFLGMRPQGIPIEGVESCALAMEKAAQSQTVSRRPLAYACKLDDGTVTDTTYALPVARHVALGGKFAN